MTRPDVPSDGVVTLFVCGDVMLGRGVDQILPSPGDPALQDTYVRDARTYVALAEAANGPIDRPVDWSWVWGDTLAVLDEVAPAVRVVNLETSVTGSDDVDLGKSAHYRMSPLNLPCLTAVRPDVCVLANNHVLDYGRRGLEETLDVLGRAGVRTAGAGRDLAAARQPAVVPLDGGRHVIVHAFGMLSSGVPAGWAATADVPGVDVVDESAAGAEQVVERVQHARRPGDLVVVSVHWGSNWGYDVPRSQVRFAHTLVDGGVDLVHGHSSHHPRPVEVYRDRLVLYGCGDFVDDYEGITGYEQFRDDLRLLYLVSVEAGTGRLVDLRMVPLQARRMRLHHAARHDGEWLRSVLDRVSAPFGSHVEAASDGTLTLVGT